MEDSISKALYRWLIRRRILSEVARQMNVDESNLSAKLRANKNRTRLAADELFPLCKAIRDAGYGKELKGILHPFVEELRGADAEPTDSSESDIVTRVLALGKGMSLLFDCAARISKMTNPAEIRELKTVVRTEILPVVLQADDLLDRRLKKVTHSKPVRARVVAIRVKS